MQKLFKIVKKFILSAFIIYGYNMIAVNFNMIVPINIWSVVFVAIFDLPALVTLIILKFWGV